LDITEVSKSTNLPASTLRFYEDKGLIQSIGRKGLRRVYRQDILQQVALISLGRSAGFSLDEIRTMLNQGHSEIDRSQLLKKVEDLNKKILELTRMRDGLQHAAACKAVNHFECPKFLRLLKIAQKVRPKAKIQLT
jgi:DNA-binding transcriptional MerR regulator